MSKCRKMPTHQKITEHWRARPPSQCAADAIESSHDGRICWACGATDREKMTRCHIVAASAGGSDDPDNLWLLCETCHREQPDGCPLAAQLMWLRSRPSQWDRIAKPARDACAWLAAEGVARGLTVDDLVAADINPKAVLGSAPPSAAAHTSNHQATLVVTLVASWLDAASRDKHNASARAGDQLSMLLAEGEP